MIARLYAFTALSALVGLVLLWLTLQLPGGEQVSTLIGPRTWPLIILIVMLALTVLMAALLALSGPSQFASSDEAANTEAPEAEIVDQSITRDHPGGYAWRHIAVLAATIAYTIGMEFTGYLLATAVFAAAATLILGERRPLNILLTTATTIVLVAVVFDSLLNIPLP